MKILSIGKKITHNDINIQNINFSSLANIEDVTLYDYIIISGGDGSIRRCVHVLQTQHKTLPPFILNAQGSFNVVAKLHRVPKLEKVLDAYKKKIKLITSPQETYHLNDEMFLFAAGNMGDLQHIFLSETLRFGMIKKGFTKYFLAGLFLFPIHVIMTPFMLLSPQRFFIFTPFKFIPKFGSFYGRVKEMEINLKNEYNLMQLDGDVVTIKESILQIKPARTIDIVTKVS